MFKNSTFKRFISGLLAGIILLTTTLPTVGFAAEDNSKFPYTIFASSNKEGAITVDAENFTVNGDIATNGTIISTGNMNINGSKSENVNKKMIYIFDKLTSTYFSGDNVIVYPEDYSNNDMNINLNIPMDVRGTLELTGNISLNTELKTENNIHLTGDAINSNNSIITSQTGDIIIDGMNVNLNGLIYAPDGNILINAQNVNMNNVILIGQTITINASTVNANYSSRIAEIVGGEEDSEINPELPLMLYTFGRYITEDNSIEITWETTEANGTFDIETSEDNDNYTFVDTVSDDTIYNYTITEPFDKMYLRVTETTYYGETISSIPIVLLKVDSGYEVDLLDSDGDGLPDILEEVYGTDPLIADTDGDGLTDGQEVFLTNTDPLVANSFDDNLSDADADCDEDGLSNIEEIIAGTDPLIADTDGDGLTDWEEIHIYNTDPLNPDTDGDTILDGDEIEIGLDPTNPETFGIPDAEYVLNQSVSADSRALSKINTEDSPYELSIDISAAGYVEGNIKASETSHSKVISNDFMIGIAPELEYEHKDSIESVTLKFEISEKLIEDSSSLFPEEDELKGIKRFNIFKYFEEINMLLPIDTKFDIENNIIYSNVDELGTYCIMDMELWLSSFELPEEDEKNNKTPSSMSFINMSYNKEEFTEEETRIVVSENVKQEEKNYANNINTISSMIDKQLASNNKMTHTPIDVVFIFQTAGVSETYFESQKKMIKEVSSNLYDTYSDVKICLIEFKKDEASIVSSFNFPVWQENKAGMATVLGKLSYDYTAEYCNRGAGFSKMLNDLTLRDNSGKFVFLIKNGSTSVSSGYFDQINACERRNINYTEISPKETYFVDPNYEKKVVDAIARTNGLNLTYGNETGYTVYNHIVSHVAPPRVKFEAIVPTGWKKIFLDDVLDPLNGVDTDEDKLTDWEEVDTDKINWETDGTILLPTIRDCMRYANKPYAEDGLERFKSEQWAPGMPTNDFEKYLFYILDNTNILPIHSDPTDEDTDGDGYNDNVDPRPLISDVTTYYLKEIERYIPVEYDGPEKVFYNKGIYYGGNQSWFYDDLINNSDDDLNIEKGACGVLASTDLIMYLTLYHSDVSSSDYFKLITSREYSDSYIKYEDYTNFVRKLVKWNPPVTYQILWKNGTYGYLPPQIEILLYNYFKMFDINLNVVSKRTKPMDKDLMIEGIISQIKNDIPVPIMAGFGDKREMTQIDPITGISIKRKDGTDNVNKLKLHWVNIVGVKYDKIKGNKVLEVASWGKKYIIDFDEYFENSNFLDGVIWLEKQ